MSDFSSLKQVILGCVSRTSNSFVAGTTNFVDVAINNAITYAQRQVDFEWNKCIVRVPCNPYGYIHTAFQDLEQVKIKRIIKAFGVVEPTFTQALSVPYLSRVSQIADETTSRQNHCFCLGTRVVHEGQKVFIVPQPQEQPYDLFFYAVKWLPLLVEDSDTNFLLEYAYDYIMYRSIVELNFFIKEDERFQINQAMLGSAWNSVVAWDASLVSPTETEIEL